MLLAAAIATPAHGWIPGPFIIFFDSGSDRLDEPTRAILDNVAAAIDAMHPASIVMAGHADRAGEPGRNRLLSCRRARAARAYLATRGVAPERMVIEGYGEERVLVDTDDGVPEPQNRRVEFLLSDRAPYRPTWNC
jgi:outer membrane protein OmpA-like peptidoglycan-associated protein